MRHIHFWRSATPRPLWLSISSIAPYQEIWRNPSVANQGTAQLPRYDPSSTEILNTNTTLNDETNQRSHVAEPGYLKEEQTALRPQQINSNRCPEQEFHPTKSPNQPHYKPLTLLHLKETENEIRLKAAWPGSIEELNTHIRADYNLPPSTRKHIRTQRSNPSSPKSDNKTRSQNKDSHMRGLNTTILKN